MRNNVTTNEKYIITIIRQSSIGDVILSSSCLHMIEYIKERTEKDLSIIWIGKEPTSELLKKFYPSIKVLNLKKTYEIFDLLKEIKNSDILIDLQKNLKTQALLFLFKVFYQKKTFSLKKKYNSRFFSLLKAKIYGRKVRIHKNSKFSFQFQQINLTVYHALNYLQLVKKEDMQMLINHRPLLPLDIPKPSMIKEGQTYLAIAPGARYQTKKAPNDIFIAILSHLAKKLHESNKSSVHLILIGNAEDKENTGFLSKKLNWNGSILDFAGKKSLFDTAKILKFCSASLCNDSAIAHISEALQKPVAMLFGPTIEQYGFAPHLAKSQAFSSNLGCRPCSKHGSIKCRYNDHLCFKEINTQKVSDHLYTLLFE